MTINIDDTLEHQGDSMYYKHTQRRWVCLDCEYDTKSPYGASCHAASHGLTLPNHRKEKPKKIQVPVQIVKKSIIDEHTNQPDPEIPKKEERFNPDTNPWPLIRTVEKPHFMPKIEPEDPILLQMKKKLKIAQQVQALQMTGVFSKEQIEELRIQYGLTEKPQPESNNNNLMLYLMLQNSQNNREPSFSDKLWNALEKAMIEKIKEEELTQ